MSLSVATQDLRTVQNRQIEEKIDVKGGAITNFQSTVTFTGPGISTLVNNQARRGGAIVAK